MSTDDLLPHELAKPLFAALARREGDEALKLLGELIRDGQLTVGADAMQAFILAVEARSDYSITSPRWN